MISRIALRVSCALLLMLTAGTTTTSFAFVSTSSSMLSRRHHAADASSGALHLQRSHPSSLLPVQISYEHSQSRTRRRKRDLVRPWSRRNRGSTAGAYMLSMRSDSNDESATPEEVNSKNSTSTADAASNNSNVTLASSETNDGSFSLPTMATVTETVQRWLTSALSFLNGIKYWLASFFAGAVVAGAALLVPIYSQVQTLTQPVTLFETILSDLDQAYVDPVDTNKLFETGVNAMLRSLDPYTEFEGKEDAVAMTESIEGRYGGVGLVIAGTTGKTSSNLNKAARSTTTSPASVEQQPISNDDASQATPPETSLQQQKDGGTSTESSSPLNKKNGDDTSSMQKSAVPVASAATNEEDFTGLDNNNNNDFVYDADEDMDFDYVSLDDDDEYPTDAEELRLERTRAQKAAEKGIRVVSAFEGYAFDYGMRVGDKLVAIDDTPIEKGTSVEQVRNQLRGEPGTLVTIRFERDGVPGIQSVTMPRSVVRVRDVKLATLLGDPADGIGYIQLSGFAADTGREMRRAIQYLQRAAEDASLGERPLQGLVLDLRGNPGGLLTSAVDVCSLLVPKGSDIVSAKGRGFPGILYRSRVEPVLDQTTKLAVLVNGQTASAAEIVSGAVQDLDVGVVIGSDRTFGKGLVQNVESLPFDTALKFTVAKYYTPSGRCIQGVNYQEGGGNKMENSKYVAKKVAEKDRATFYTKSGRVVRDGGGIEADFKVQAPRASALEVTLLRSGVLNEFAAEWSKTNELSNNFEVDEDTYKRFQTFVAEKQRKGELELESLYSKPLSDLKKSLKVSGYIGAEKSVEQLQARIVRDIQSDFQKYRNDIKEDISQNILARYLPESMLVERGAKNDVQVQAAIKLLSNEKQFDRLLARGSFSDTASPSAGGNTLNMASGSSGSSSESSGARGKIEW